MDHFDPWERDRHTRKEEIVIKALLTIADLLEYVENYLECRVKTLHTK